jgi:hypothetical protein
MAEELKMSALTIERVSQRYWDDLRWASEHGAELDQRFGIDSPYGGSIWIAIYNQKVVAWSPSLMEAKRTAAEKIGVAPSEIPVKFIESIAAIYDQIAL